MKKCMLLACLFLFALAGGLSAQSASTQETTLSKAEFQYFRSMLMAVSGVDSDATVAGGLQNALARHLGLEESEKALLAVVATQFRQRMQALVAQQKAIPTDGGNLSEISRNALLEVANQRDGEVRRQAGLLLSALHPKTAAYIRAYCLSSKDVLGK